MKRSGLVCTARSPGNQHGYLHNSTKKNGHSHSIVLRISIPLKINCRHLQQQQQQQQHASNPEVVYWPTRSIHKLSSSSRRPGAATSPKAGLDDRRGPLSCQHEALDSEILSASTTAVFSDHQVSNDSSRNFEVIIHEPSCDTLPERRTARMLWSGPVIQNHCATSMEAMLRSKTLSCPSRGSHLGVIQKGLSTC